MDCGDEFDYAAFALPLEDVGTLGLSFTSLSMDDMIVRTVEKPMERGTLQCRKFCRRRSLCEKSVRKIFIGFTAKYVSERIWICKRRRLPLMSERSSRRTS